MWVVRPARPDDLAEIQSLAASQAARVSTLPQAEDKLADKLDQSLRSFQGAAGTHGEERFLFVLEDLASGRIRGTAGIDARAGCGQPFYNYRQDALIHASHELGVSSRVDVLYPSHALTDNSLLCSFTIDRELRETEAFDLLSRSRLLFIAQHRERFADRLVVEIQGVQDDQGQVPFWDSLGRHFFNMDFATADQHSSELSKTFIAELMPPNPIYVTLLTDAAQAAIRQPHALAHKTVALLEREGFQSGNYIDIFDGGPVLQARTDSLKTVVTSQRLEAVPGEVGDAPRYLVATGTGDAFRAVLSPLAEHLDGTAVMPADVEKLPGWQAGQPILVAPL
ncbi:MAG: arginine N-succinyltransferase [Marinobacter sp.]|uniref:arginine N-succinyltransferase n=1 Tax=Marinobacter sp. TaxID=50741 RepID=UPI00299D0DCE|nr:arginine N-succinyltransferase [Marinobacter sp.]MDX1634029.1 arginine N-succinyltransferase [Marinobacter sp.]